MMKLTKLFVVGIVFGLAALAALGYYRSQVQHQVHAILQEDLTGPVSSTQMTTLKQYVASHLGTTITIRLNGAYGRDQSAASAAAQTQPSGNIYQQAQAACAGLKIATQQAQCNESYLQSHLQTTPSASPVAQPQLSNYTYTFRSPLWTPDLTGFLMAASIAAFLWAALKLIFSH